jgi:hypothetical protein
MHLAGADQDFFVSPAEFTVLKAPPLGAPWKIQQELVVWNRDNVERLVFVKAEIPPENAVRPGYEPIENENWVIPLPSSVVIMENSFKEIQISLNIPRWENLTNKKWEVWIPVEREPLPGEIGVLRPTVRIKIETTAELPSLPGISPLFYIAVTIVAGVVVGALGLWVWLKRGPRKRRSNSRIPPIKMRFL